MRRISRKTWEQMGLVAGFGGLLLLGVAWLRRWQTLRKRAITPRRRADFQIDGISPRIQGLTATQAAALLPASVQAPDRKAEQRKFLKQAIRQTLFTIFNFNLFAMLLVNLLFKDPVGASLTLLLLALNMALRIFQITYTKRHMDEIVQSVQPRASVIRDGQLQSIDPPQIVPGDYLVIGDGDEILVDGKLTGDHEITIEQLNPTGKLHQARKKTGEMLQAGSYCVAGRGIYIAQEGGWQRHSAAQNYQFKLMHSERTPLQRLTENILRILLGIVLAISTVLILDAILVQSLLTNAAYRNAFSIVFGVAPTGLFMILILKNLVGVLRISRRGALVYDPQAIETLAQVKTLCISKESLISGLRVSLEPIESGHGEPPLSENIIRQILGDMVHSVSGYDTTMQMLIQALPGEQRRVKEMASFWQHLGWFGLTFADADRQGTYILGQENVLAPRLHKKKVEISRRVEAAVTDAGQGLGKFLQRFSRAPDKKNGTENASPMAEFLPEDSTQGETPNDRADDSRPTARQQTLATLRRWLTPIEELPEVQNESSEQPETETSILFAYLPETVSLYDRRGKANLPADLIPLARVQANEMIRPEAQQTLTALFDEGMQINILTSDPPDSIAPLAKALGIPDEKINQISGVDVPEKTEPGATSREVLIIGDLSPRQKAAVVNAFRRQDAYVLMIGSAVGDVPALRQAYLGVTTRNGAQAALRESDIVLLDDSIAVLPRILTEGQRMINGVLITFKLQLSKVLMQLLLILLLFLNVLDHFPYQSTQGGVASVFTITIPNIFLVLWASANLLTQASMRRQLLRFIIPVALTLAILVGGIFTFFNTRDGDPAYANLAVTYALLLAGWVRVFFVQPPSKFWVGDTPLRGDLRVYRVVFGSALLLTVFLLFPFFQESFKITALASWWDFSIVVMAVLAWALTLRTVWRVGNGKR